MAPEETVTLNAILAELRHPKAKAHYTKCVQDVLPSAKLLQTGSERTAYVVGRWVVKKATDRPHPPLRMLRQVGVQPPTQVLINGWQVQPRYRRLSNINMKTYRRWMEVDLDLGSHNVGKDRWGRYVAFDW